MKRMSTNGLQKLNIADELLKKKDKVVDESFKSFELTAAAEEADEVNIARHMVMCGRRE